MGIHDRFSIAGIALVPLVVVLVALSEPRAEAGPRDLPPITQLASRSPFNQPANAPITEVDISGNGRFVAFTTKASNLDPTDTNGVEDVYVADLETGTVVRVSRGLGGASADRPSTEPSISDDGSRVVFTSPATNLVTGDTNNRNDIFLAEVFGGGVSRISVWHGGIEYNTCPANIPYTNCQHQFAFSRPYISGNGQYVLFAADEFEVYNEMTHQFEVATGPDWYLKDLQTGLVERPRAEDGESGFDPEGLTCFRWGDRIPAVGGFNSRRWASISSNGRYVAFYSPSDSGGNFGFADTTIGNLQTSAGRSPHYYVRDRDARTTRMVDRKPDNTAPVSTTYHISPGEHPMSVSDTGQVVFESNSPELVQDDSNGVRDVFLGGGGQPVTRLSVGPAGEQSLVACYNPVISADGRRIAFETSGTNLLPPPYPFTYEIIVKTLNPPGMDWGVVSRLGIPDEGFSPALSADGSFLAFLSSSTLLVNTPSGGIQAFRRDLTRNVNDCAVSGRVINARTGEPIPGVPVSITTIRGSENTTTNSQGNFRIEELPPGTWAVKASPGSQFYGGLEAVELAPGATEYQSIQLFPRDPGLRPKVVSVSGRYFSPQRRAFFLHFPFPFAVFSLDETIEALVEWNGWTPGDVRIEAHGGGTLVTMSPVGAVSGGAQRYRVALNMSGVDPLFTPASARALSSEGTESPPYALNMRTIDLPTGLGVLLYPIISAGGIDFGSNVLAYRAPRVEHKSKSFGIDDGVLPESIPLFKAKAVQWAGTGQIDIVHRGDGSGQAIYIAGNELDAEPTTIAGQVAGVVFRPQVGGGMSWRFEENPDLWRYGGTVQISANLRFNIPPKPFEKTFFAGPVPVPVFVQARVEHTNTVQATFIGLTDVANMDVNLQSNLDPLFRLQGMVGLGKPSWKIGVYGVLGGSVRMRIQSPQTPFVQSMDLVMHGAVGVIAGPFKAERPIFEHTWSLLSAARCDTSRGLPSTLTLADRHYLNAPGGGQQFVANEVEPVSRGAVAGSTESPIQTNLFENPSPALVALGDDLLMVWQGDDPARSATNRLRLIWSYYSAATQQWSVPAAVADDGTADDTPHLSLLPGGVIGCVWQDVKEVLTEPLNPNDPAQVEAKWAEYKSKTEIAYAEFDPVMQTWNAASRLTDDAAFDSEPRISAATDGTLLATWVTNPTGHLFGSPTEPSSIWSRLRVAGVWQPAALVASPRPSVLSHDSKIRPDASTESIVVFSADTDGDPDTTDDAELFVSRGAGSSWPTPQPMTNDNVLDGAPSLCWNCYYPGWNLLWSTVEEEQTTIRMGTPTGDVDVLAEFKGGSSGAMSPRAVFAGNLRHTVVYADTVGENPGLKYIAMDPADYEWSAPRDLVGDTAVETPSAVVRTASGDLVVAYTKTAIMLQPQTTVIGGSPMTVDVPIRGATDLYTLRHNAPCDLSIRPEDITLEPPNPQGGQPVTIRVKVHNLGDSTYTPVQGRLYDGVPGQGGQVLVDEMTQSGISPPPAGVGDLTAEVVWPPDSNQLTAYVVVDPAHVLPDVDRSNNAAGRTLVVLPDLAISLGAESSGPSDWELVARVSNSGAAASPATTAVIHSGDVDGPVLATLAVPQLNPGAFFDAPFLWTGVGDLRGSSPLEISAVVDPQNLIAEANENDNAANAAVNPNVPPNVPCPGDMNDDRAVNTADLVFFLGRFGQPAPPGSLGAVADLNGDGLVNTLDLTRFLGRFGQPCP